MARNIISEELLLQADPRTGVELGVFRVKSWPKYRGYGRLTVKTEYDCRWRALGSEKWSIRSTHRTTGAATKELIRLRDNSHGLTFTQRG